MVTQKSSSQTQHRGAGSSRSRTEPCFRKDGNDYSVLLSELCTTGTKFNTVLEKFIRDEISDPKISAKMIYALRQTGQRERAFLVRLVSELVGGNFEDAMHIALASELLMASAFVSDDFLDDASIRGGELTVVNRWGIREAFLIAEMFHGLAYRAITSYPKNSNRSNWKKEHTVEIIKQFQSAFQQLLTAQQKSLALRGQVLSQGRCIKLAYEKTGILIQTIIETTGRFHNGSRVVVGKLKQFGQAFGTAFQLRDDIIDIIGEQEIIGKTILNDLWNGEQNIVLIHVLNHSRGEDVSFLKELWGSKVEQPKHIQKILMILEKSGSILHGINMVQRFSKRAQDALSTIQSCVAKDLLINFAALISDIRY